jgi:two-component system, LytTR family, response regulator
MQTTNNHLLLLPTNKGKEFINSNKIIRIAALSNYSKIYFDNGSTLVVAKLLAWFEAQLPLQQFIRTHRTHVVNKNFIGRYKKGVNDKLQLVTGEWIDVSRRNKCYFREQGWLGVGKVLAS